MSSLLVTVDALRADHLGQYGYRRDTFPAADELVAAGGTRFDAAFANGTNTGVSLPSLLTSRYVGHERARTGPTVASALPDDVATLGVHSNVYFASRAGEPAGFDEFETFGVLGDGAGDGDDGATGDAEAAGRGATTSATHRLFRRTMDLVRPTVEALGVRDLADRVQRFVFPAGLIHELSVYEDAAATTDRVLAWLDGLPADREFFAWVHYMDPHRPYGIDLDDPAYADPATESEIRDLMATAGVHPDRVTDDQRRRIVDLYDSDVRYTSEHVARLFAGLRERDRFEDAAVLLTADHGEEFGEHGRYFHRNRPYDELLHVPLFVKPPGTGAGDGDGAGTEDGHGSGADGAGRGSGAAARPSVVTDQRELLDLAPTVCAFHGVDPPAGFLGEDLFAGGPRRVIATGSFRDGDVVGVRADGWKYVDVDDGAERELYDLGADPDERESVAERHPDRCRALRASVPDALFDADTEGVPDEGDVDDDVRDRLEGLGYLE
jgi:arylsulfatase A-like enzyme